MPQHPVINRRDLDSPLVRKTLMASNGSVEAIAVIAGRLHVSQGSLIDTALAVFAARSDQEIVELLRAQGHLTPRQHAKVLEVAGLHNEEGTQQ